MHYLEVDKLFIAQARKADTFTYTAHYGYQTLRVGQYERGHRLVNETEFTAKARDKSDCRFVETYIGGSWQAMTKVLRNGDKLAFHWFNNDCDAMKKHGIRVEVLRATIYRNGKDYVRDITICTNYSTYGPNNAIKD